MNNNISNTFYFNYDNSGVSREVIESLYKKVYPEINTLTSLLSTLSYKEGYNTDYASLFLPHDKDLIKSIKSKALHALSLNPVMVILIGIGGSYFGSCAIFNALYGIYYNATDQMPQFYALDTLDEDILSDIIQIAESALKLGKNIILIIATKSGTTTETIANAAFFIDLLKKYKPKNYYCSIYVITDANSELSHRARAKNFTILEVPPQVGGRFSVLSAIGLFPLALLGVDIDLLCQGAYDMQQQSHDYIHNKYAHDISTINNTMNRLNYAAISALIIYYHYNTAKNIHDSFFFSPLLGQLGSWYRQLVGESLGKKYSRDNKQIEIGITPTISLGTTDLHSVVQLYLGGPRDKLTTFISYNSNKDFIIPDTDLLCLAPHIKSKSVASIKEAIFQGVLKAYAQEKRPFMVINIPYKSSYALGQFLMMKMLEVVYLGHLFNINPFDQPEVELYKSKTRVILNQAQ